MTLAAGTRLGTYEILAPLGVGGMGEVYRARDPRLGREVAIKVLPEALADDPSRLGRFEREAKATGALNHPHILAIHDIGEHERRPYVVYELLEGQTLGGRMREGPLPPHEALTWAMQIAQGLAAAHAKGIVHRDLKPENLFLTEAGPLKILDFGLAKVARPEIDDDASIDPEDLTEARQSLTAEGAILGTVGYMSPEQVKGGRADHRSDIFSLGVVLYEMLSGERPFRGETVPETMAAILREDPPELADPKVSPALAEIVGRCLAKEPDERFQSAHDLSLALSAVSGVERGAETVSSVGSAAASTGPGRTFLLLGAGLVALVGLAAGARWLMTSTDQPRMIGPRQVTTDGQGKWDLATDGTSLYYAAFSGQMLQASVAGGEPRMIDPWPDEQRWNWIHELSPTDPTRLIVGSRTTPWGINLFEEAPLWEVTLPAATPRRLGEVDGGPSTWSPDGTRIAFPLLSDVFVLDMDGGSPRKILSLDGKPSVLDWSPDNRIAYTVWRMAGGGSKELRVARADGSDPRPLLPEWPDSHIWDARWTPDGRYLLFVSGDAAGGQFWVFEEGGVAPSRLTGGPLSCYVFSLTPEGGTVYATCARRQSELFVYRPEIAEWAPYDFPPEPRAARQVAHSPDGEWVAWTKWPEGTLWRSRRDGSQKLQLTGPSNLRTSFKAWSPDGQWIVFARGTLQGLPTQLWVISKDGQDLRALAGEESGGNRGAWAPDGRVVLSFERFDVDPDPPLQVVDLGTGESEEMPGTNGLAGVASSPDGRLLAAHDWGRRGREQGPQIRLYDWEASEWRALEGAVGGLLEWSADGRYLYFGCGVETAQRVCRVRPDTGEIETVAGEMPPLTLWHVDPEGRLVIPRSLELWDIYAWDLDLR